MGITGVALAATAISGAVSAYGSASSGAAQKQAFQYQAGVAQMNAQIAKQNADYAIAAGEVTAQESGMKTRYQIGTTIAQQGAGGLAVGSGSNARVVDSEWLIGQQDESIIRSNAARQAYGYEIQGANATAQGVVDTMAGTNAQTAGNISAFGSILGAAGSVSSKWLAADAAGAFGGSGGAGSSFGKVMS